MIFFIGIFPLYNGMAQDVGYSVRANIIYHFTKYVNWPEFNSNSDFVIGVLGNSTIVDELKKVTAGKSLGYHKIVVKPFTSSESSYVCNLLFISEAKSSSLKRVLAMTESLSVLIVTEEEGLSSKGACINFVVEDDKTKLEFNTGNIIKRNLKIANELLALGTIVK
ncbi:MAG: YfiR family protein [Bacteroidetes bacterium]|nr:YfiR family protein [Bacteroidota bacterium]MBK7570352.1 YfiR family protein [Bacteroidota bacterium]MBL0031272.1 YfiR family protein [Bacteroidota bacterium]